MTIKTALCMQIFGIINYGFTEICLWDLDTVQSGS